ncbi:unnamed protein product, partial [Urochloa humidicola]
ALSVCVPPRSAQPHATAARRPSVRATWPPPVPPPAQPTAGRRRRAQWVGLLSPDAWLLPSTRPHIKKTPSELNNGCRPSMLLRSSTEPSRSSPSRPCRAAQVRPSPSPPPSPPERARSRAPPPPSSPGSVQNQPPLPCSTASHLRAASTLKSRTKPVLEQVLADGNYELVPAGGEGQADGEVNVVQAEQDPNQVPEDLQANPALEGSSLEEVAASLNWQGQLPPGWTIEWETTDAE